MFKNKKVSFIGLRILLRIMEPEDVSETTVSWLNDPEVIRYWPKDGTDAERQKKFVIAKNEQENALYFLIILKEGQRPIGTIKLEYIDLVKGRTDIALMLGEKDCWGKGLMAEAMKLLIDYSFDQLGLKTVYLGVAADNDRALRLYQKLGFTETHRVSMGWKHTEPNCDHVWMEIKKPGV